MLIKIRPATEADSQDLWRWRNHPEIRKWCFDAKEIDYDDHKKWFDRKIKEENAKIYIAENEALEKLGQIRFEIQKDGKARISVNLNPDFLVNGLGNKIIRAGTEFYLKEIKDIKEVIAEVIKENIASEKAFKKAGYTLSGGGNKEGRQILVLTYRQIK